MRAFQCRVCGADLFFENSLCVSCGSSLGYSQAEKAIVPVVDGRYFDPTGTAWFVCANLDLNGCTWLTQTAGGICASCLLTRKWPGAGDPIGLSQLRDTEAAKRHLLYELDDLGLPIEGKATDPECGLAFDLLSSAVEEVVIGHDSGVITIDVAETDDGRRERIRAELGEPYRTMLGHLRHEVGHYIEFRMVTEGPLLDRCRELFGDDTVDYQAELDRHYSQGPPLDWQENYISTYATMHPYEDFAETFAHYLHISDTIDTAAEQGLVRIEPDAFRSFSDLVTGVWRPLSTSLNQINRSMGKHDLYPFIIPGPVLDKLDFVASLALTGAGGQNSEKTRLG